MNPVLTIAQRAALSAGRILLRHFDHLERLNVTAKQRNDFVSDADLQAEQEIIQTLRKSYPNHAILAEESGAQPGQEEYQWVIDPLDGTTNFLHGIPHFAVSIALRHKNRLEAALIYDPIRQEMFTAARGGSAQMNDRRIRVSGVNALENSLLGTGFPFRHPTHQPAYLNMFSGLFGKCMEIRRAGAASLDLAYVACGRLDAFWEIGLKPWDIAGGALLVQEAGGLVSDFGGGNDFMQTGNIVAGNPKLFKALLQEIQPHLTSELAR
ncbi:inositol monophosphatase [Candidatus Competibacter denitrificans Run_A_D11]|uniref:Inositol-1-monophosphatase n=1 Tax=Candidatus Competibacter denitrificans Run_A_D11 TaxID=1400863 RepID=W6M2T1_9GAMM|nr:inositol monophosphatase family protein [Candidatus Competibacter denitrificans]CDI00794.1 inositol monophosphatase [Candidatus Competibacter denitrificans Run_A_D11]HCK82063.1 inositol monophosphatase [Candidatus Competibacteraceae bacterium]HRC69681.1 inositol monophosphatase family protein [Candidatus Competibacter denitrificans]